MSVKMPKNIKILSLVSLLNDFSSEMIMPILPMYLSNLGVSPILIGLIGGLRTFIGDSLKVVFGIISDRIGKYKIFVFLGYFTSGVFKFFLSLCTAVRCAFWFSILERTGKGMRTAPRDTLIYNSLSKHTGRAFGFHRAFDTVGALLGSVAVLLMFWKFKMTFNTIILWAAIISIFSVIPILSVNESRKKEPTLKKRILSINELSGELKKFLVTMSIFSLANFSYMFFILKVQSNFDATRFSVVLPIIFYIFFNIFYALFSYPFGILSEKIGKEKVICLGYGLFSLACLGFIISQSTLFFLILFIIYGLSLSATDSIQRAYVSSSAPKAAKSATLGLFHTVSGLATFVGSTLAGFLWRFTPKLTFGFGAFLGTLATGMLFGEILKQKT